MAWLTFFNLIVCLIVLQNCHAYTKLNRKVRNVNPGESYFNDVSEESIREFHMQHDTSRSCMEAEGNKLVPSVCDDNNVKQKFKFVPTAHNEGAIQNVGNGQCLFASGSSLSWKDCSASSKYPTHTGMIWGCYLPKSAANSPWVDQDFVGLKLKNQNKCLSVRNTGYAFGKTCTKVKGDVEQKLFVKGAKDMSICAKSGYFGPRTNDTSYYYFKTPAFKIPSYVRYVEVFVVYGNGVYQAFKNKYGANAAIKKIHEHAQDTHNIVDKLYRKVNLRFVVSGVEIWSSGDKIKKAANSQELHNNFRYYAEGLKKKFHFDIPLYVFDGDMFGAAGTATNSFCSSVSFVIATVQREDKIKARSLAHILTHEYGHEINSPHTWDAPNTCPVYHLFGGRCTLGGNDWPKGLSSNELKKLRDNPYSCMKNKPSQKQVMGCGNGRLEEGEECDCGTSQACLLNNPCCDGQICKLKSNAECNNEGCCTQCKWDRRKSGCQGKTNYIKKDYGVITHPTTQTKNNYEHWKIITTAGSRAVLYLTLSLFEFEEGCPFDYIKVYDGGNANGKLLGTFCRTPTNMKVEGSGNELFITLKTDSSHESHFKLVYTTADADIKPSNFITYHLRTFDLKCITAKNNELVTTTSCTDTFVYTRSHHLKHVKTGKCVNTEKYYGRSYSNAKLLLDNDCTAFSGKFGLLGKKKVFHSESSLCIENYNGMKVTNNCNTNRNAIAFQKVGEIQNGYYNIKHSGGRCVSINSNNELYFASKCDTKFKMTSDGKIIDENGSCYVGQTASYGSPIVKSACSVPGVAFTKTKLGSLKQTSTGRCMHPDNGSPTPNEGTKLVLWGGCDEDRLKFTFVKGVNPVPTNPPPLSGQLYIIKHFAGRCLAIGAADGALYLTDKCTTKIRFTTKGEMQDESGKFCFAAKHDGNGAALVKSLCGIDGINFYRLPFGSIQNLVTKRCFHPNGGSTYPSEGTKVVMYNGCDDSNKLKFVFQKGE